MQRTKQAKLLLMSTFFILLLFVGYLLINSFEKNKKEYYLDVQSELLKVKYETSYKYFKVMTKDIHDMYQNNTKLIKLFAQARTSDRIEQAELRTEMFNTLKKNYKRLNNMGISQVHFYLPNNKSFLRMYKPEKFGDDVSKIKESVRLTNKNTQFSEGFEACTFMLGLRFVYPLFDTKKNLIGSVEISYSTQELLHSITDDFVYDSHVLVSKTLTKGTIIEKELQSNYKSSWETQDYYIEDYTHKSIGDLNFYSKLNTQEVRSEIAKGIKSAQSFSITHQYNYQNIIISFLPLADVKGSSNIAYIVTYTESDYLSNLVLERNYVLLLFFIVMIMLFIFSFYVVNAQAKLRELALFDTLTQLPNRTLFMVELSHELGRASRYKNKLAVLFLDLDGFKAVNDTFGHEVGDKLLVKIAKILSSSIRSSDLAARLGGDEFTIILTDIKDAQNALKIANVIVNTIAQEIIIDNDIIHVGASVGIAMYPEHSNDMDTLIKHADAMMYQAKKQGKGCVVIKENQDV